MSKISVRINCPLCGADVAEYKLKSHIGSRRCSMRIDRQTSVSTDPMRRVPNWRRMADRVASVSDNLLGKL